LAKKRRTCDHFDTKALSEEGFLVRVGQKQVELPNGDIVADGTAFRDKFHLWEGMRADFFVPCGGRPGSVGLSNVHRMFDKHGRPRFKYVVEGANLFITEGARDILQDRGVILFKDSSSNKGGVTCSSLEVLASLALTDQQYAMHMTEDTDGTVPPFYETYVQEICDKVEKKASDEFRYVHETALKTNDHRTHVSDNLSASMIDLGDMITASPIFDDDEGIRNTVLAEAIPQSLQDLVGLDVVLGRVPKAYQKAIFSMHLASQYVYTHGSEPNPYQFYEFMKTRYE
jgi:glutamate dehydrogenase